MTALDCRNGRATYDRVCRSENLRKAWTLVRKGGPAPGVDGRTLDQFAVAADAEIRRIEADLRNHSYRFMPVRRTFVSKQSGGKRRLGIPAVRDRVVEQAIRLVLEPVLAPGFAPTSFAYRSGRGVQEAMDRLLDKRRRGQSWIAESDIQDFFDSIEHSILLKRLGNENVDAEVVRLVAAFLNAGARFGSRWFASRRGVPQGSPASPLLANYYLTSFDRAMFEQGHELVRFADDFVICCSSRREVDRALADVGRELALLKLKVNRAKTRVLDSRHESFDFLGFAIRPRSIEPTPENVERFRHGILELIDAFRHDPLPQRVSQLNSLIRSFGYYYRRCHAADLFATLDGWVQRQLRGPSHSNGCGRFRELPGLVHLTGYLQPPSRPWVKPVPARDNAGYGGWRRPRARRREDY